jgi:hypothetical protein
VVLQLSLSNPIAIVSWWHSIQNLRNTSNVWNALFPVAGYSHAWKEFVLSFAVAEIACVDKCAFRVDLDGCRGWRGKNNNLFTACNARWQHTWRCLTGVQAPIVLSVAVGCLRAMNACQNLPIKVCVCIHPCHSFLPIKQSAQGVTICYYVYFACLVRRI